MGAAGGLSTSARGTAMDAILALFPGGKIQIGTATAAGAYNTLLCEFTLPSPAGTQSSGVITLGSISNATPSATGKANAFRLVNSSGTVIHERGNESRTFANTDINTTTNVITVTGHTFVVGDRVKLRSSGTISTDVTTGTIYEVGHVATNTLWLRDATTHLQIDWTTQGTGTYTIHQVDWVSGASEGGQLRIAIAPEFDGVPVTSGAPLSMSTGTKTITLPA